MKNKKIAFQKLVDNYCPYSPSEKLQLLEIFLRGSSKYSTQRGWHRDGIDKLLYDYSANNHRSHTKISSWNEVYMMFIRAIVVSLPTNLQVWRDDLGIKLSDSKFFRFDTQQSNPYLEFKNKCFFKVLESLKGAKLKKEFFHPDYSQRLNPFIKNIYFTISENGCYIFLEFTFDDCLDSGWRQEFWKRDKSLEDFFFDTFKSIDNLLLIPQIF